MTFLFMLLGALLGAFVCAGVFRENLALSATLLSAFIGLLLAQQARLRAQVAALEQGLLRLRGEIAARASSERAATQTAAPPSTEPVAAPVAAPLAPPASSPISAAAAAPSVSAPAAPIPPTPGPVAAAAPVSTPPAAPAPPVRPVLIRAPLRPDPVALLIERVKNWFMEGNVPVKVGVIVLFLGVAALLKYAADAGWLTVPVEFRLAGIAAAALGALVFAWRKRESHRAFALSLQGGAIGVLLLTVFAAFRLYHLLPAGLAFALLVVVVAAAGMLAVLQEALALAVLAIVGGFLAPILVSTGNGNHVALFSYYAVLNAMIFAIAWIRPWRALNLLGFAFTFGVGTAWGVLGYSPAKFASTEPFLLLFFAFYTLIPLLYARRLAAEKRDLIDGTLVFGTPLIAFALQASLLQPERLPMAFSALGAAAIYTALAWLELRRLGLRLLGESHALLALGFATLAVPLALSTRLTACTWAIEGAALVWLGLRQERRLPRWIGYALQGAAGVAYLNSYVWNIDDMPIANGAFAGGVLIALAGLVSARLLSRRVMQAPMPILLFLWGWALWWFAAGNDIARFVVGDMKANWWLALVAFTGALGAAGFRRLSWRESAWPALASFALALPLIALTAIGNDGVLEGWGAAAWALWLVCALWSLRCLSSGAQPFVHIAHFAFLWTVALVLSAELFHVSDERLALGDVWVGLGVLAPLAALFWFVLSRAGFVRWPDAAVAERLRHFLLISLASVLACGWIAGLFIEGQPAPLPYLPVLNPLELAQLGFLLLMLAWYRRAAADGHAFVDAEIRARVLAVAGIVLLTAITLRAAHFLGGVPWDEQLWDSPLAQAALSIVWTIAGIAAMLFGKQRGSRAVWIGGSVLMGVVILKLLVIDRQHLHDLASIVGVLIVGVLLVGVGYFAPAPPRLKMENA
jgi:uncharacterized membrane protein